MSSINFVKNALQHLVFAEVKQPLPRHAVILPTAYSFTSITQLEKEIPEEFLVQKENWTEGERTITRAKFIEAVSIASELDDDIVFQMTNDSHNELAKPLYNVFYYVDLDSLGAAMDYAQKYVNKYLFQYVLTLALRHRPDLKSQVQVPSQITLAPYLYFDMGDLLIAKADDEKIITLTGKFDYDNQSIDVEQRLEYFRLDPGLNAHHRHWHEAYLDAGGYQKRDVVRNRAGELFYYMHSQMMSRYNFERLSAKAPLVEPLYNLGDPLAEPYFNRLTTETKAKLWDSRPPYQRLRDITANGRTIRIQDLELWRTRIYEAIDRGYIYAKDEDGFETVERLNSRPKKTDKNYKPGVPFDDGINTLGNMVWAFQPQSKNFAYYGNLHNSGHMIIGYSHDPVGLYYKQSLGGAMTMLETACRDPAFYRWHMFIDDIFERYKATLAPYEMDELKFPGIRIDALKVVDADNKETTTLYTKWVKDRVDITRGVPPSIKKTINVEGVYYDFVHLGHEPFSYKLEVHSAFDKPTRGVVRIFMAPRYTDMTYKEMVYRQGEAKEAEVKEKNPYFEPSFNKMRRMFVEMDKFVVILTEGSNVIHRRSDKSSVTVPMKQLFMTLEEALAYTEKPELAREELSWCGCGWPDYLLLGKGTAAGQPCHLFAMISDFEADKADDYTPGSMGENKNGETGGSLSYCGVRNQHYPDRKPMGYPFDRMTKEEPELWLKDFVTTTRNPKIINPEPIENMIVTEIQIKHVAQPQGPEVGPTIKNFKPPPIGSR